MKPVFRLALLPVLGGLLLPALARAEPGERAVDMGSPVLSATFVGPHAADCVAASGPRSEVEINGCFDKNLDPVMKAWQRAVQRNANAGGRISLRLRIAASGKVSAAHIESADPLLDRQFRQELLDISRGIDFLPAGRALSVTHAFRFSPR